MKIIQVGYSLVEIEDEQGHRLSVFLGDDKRWKCLRCQRYHCEHAKWVASQNPTLPEVSLADVDVSDLIDE